MKLSLCHEPPLSTQQELSNGSLCAKPWKKRRGVTIDSRLQSQIRQQQVHHIGIPILPPKRKFWFGLSRTKLWWMANIHSGLFSKIWYLDDRSTNQTCGQIVFQRFDSFSNQIVFSSNQIQIIFFQISNRFLQDQIKSQVDQIKSSSRAVNLKKFHFHFWLLWWSCLINSED